MRKHLPVSIFISSILVVALSAPVFAVDKVTTPGAAIAPKLKITTLTNAQLEERRAQELKLAGPTGSALPKTTVITANLSEQYRAKMQTLRLNFQNKLATIKDTVKKNTVTRIDNMMTTVNKNRTSEMLVNLNTMSAILDRVATRTASAKSNGKDTSSVEVAIAAARASITTAHNLVVAQVAKQYVITINSDTTLKADVKAVVDTFKVDIKATHEAVVAAREAVRAAIQALVKVL